jgi:hypothetical protein
MMWNKEGACKMSWDFRIRGYAGSRHPRRITPGTILGETVHRGETSAAVEIDAWQSRMGRGEVSHVELIDIRQGGRLTNLHVYEYTKIPWSWAAKTGVVP